MFGNPPMPLLSEKVVYGKTGPVAIITDDPIDIKMIEGASLGMILEGLTRICPEKKPPRHEQTA